MNKFLLSEKEYHDKVAKQFAVARERDYIWEIPEELILLRMKYFFNKCVVDMGCGPGINIKNVFFKKDFKNCKYIGVDISKKMLDIAKKNIPYGIFINSDMSNLKIKKNSIDTILSCGSLHHVENKIKTISNWYSLLKKDGYFLFREPLIASLPLGSGASPLEEGIDLSKILDYFKFKKIKVHKIYFFGSPFFHFINKMMLKFMSKFWKDKKLLWYPFILIDLILSTLIFNKINYLKPDTVLLIAQKV